MSAEIGDRPTFVADIVGAHWLYGGVPLKGGSPWSYGLLDGLSSAELLAVPNCPINTRIRNTLLSEIEDAGVTVSEVSSSPLMILYRIGGSESPEKPEENEIGDETGAEG